MDVLTNSLSAHLKIHHFPTLLGWFTLHPYVYIAQQNTDDDGWQYRSTWSNGSLTPEEEQWGDLCEENKLVRRRLWMVTVVKRDDLIRSKGMACEELAKAQLNEPILQETMLMYQPSDGIWQRRKLVLHHTKIELFHNNEKQGEVILAECDVDMLLGKENMGKEHAFALAHPDGSVKVIFDAESREMRLRWVKAITYQLAIISPYLNFQPFLFGPPTGELPEQRVLLGSSIELLNLFTKKWEDYQLHLLECCLQCFNRDAMCGRVLLEGASVKSGVDSGEFIVANATLFVTFKAKTEEEKIAWMNAIRRQVLVAEFKKARSASSNNGLGESNRSLSSGDKGKYFDEPDWCSQEQEHREDDDFVKIMKDKYEGSLKQFWFQTSSSTTSVTTTVTNTAIKSSPPAASSIRSESLDTLVDRRLNSDAQSVSTLSCTASTKSVQLSTTSVTSTTFASTKTSDLQSVSGSQSVQSTQSSVSAPSAEQTGLMKRYSSLQNIPEMNEKEAAELYRDQVASSSLASSQLYYLQPPNRSSFRLPSEIVGEALKQGELIVEEPEENIIDKSARALSLSSDDDDAKPVKTITVTGTRSDVDRDWLSSDDDDEGYVDTAPAVDVGTFSLTSSLGNSQKVTAKTQPQGLKEFEVQRRIDRFAQPNLFTSSSHDLTVEFELSNEEASSSTKEFGHQHSSRELGYQSSYAVSSKPNSGSFSATTPAASFQRPAREEIRPVESPRASTLENALTSASLRPSSRPPSRNNSNNSLTELASKADNNEPRSQSANQGVFCSTSTTVQMIGGNPVINSQTISSSSKVVTSTTSSTSTTTSSSVAHNIVTKQQILESNVSSALSIQVGEAAQSNKASENVPSPRPGSLEAALAAASLRPASRSPSPRPSSRTSSRNNSFTGVTGAEQIASAVASAVNTAMNSSTERPTVLSRDTSGNEEKSDVSSVSVSNTSPLPPRGLPNRKNSFLVHKEQLVAAEHAYSVESDPLAKKEHLRKTGLLTEDNLTETEQAALVHVHE
ncbi:hypothetical protein EON64_08385, partial [archaeon]